MAPEVLLSHHVEHRRLTLRLTSLEWMSETPLIGSKIVAEDPSCYEQFDFVLKLWTL